MIWTRALLTLPIVTSFLVGCGGAASGGPPPTSTQGKDESCEAACEAQAACDATLVESDCVDTCQESEGLSRGGVDAVATCVDKYGCGADADQTLLADCLDDELAKVTPSAEGTAFCSETLVALQECEGNEVSETDQEQCLQHISFLSDEALKELNECADNSCGNSQSLCTLAVLTDYFPSEDEAGGATTGALGEIFGSLTGGGMGGAPN